MGEEQDERPVNDVGAFLREYSLRPDDPIYDPGANRLLNALRWGDPEDPVKRIKLKPSGERSKPFRSCRRTRPH